MSNIFDGIKKVHLIGIGGIGMSGIAEYLAKKNYVVSGSDLVVTPITRRLTQFGVKFYEGHSADNLSRDVELVIYSVAVSDDNPELEKAKRMNIKLVKRAEALGNIVNDDFVISVSGTHGKTTTTAMIGKALIENKIDPTVFVGGNIDFLNDGSSKIGRSDIAVVEADEYDNSFLQLKSDIIVITNIDPDHLDIFKDIEDIKNSFRKFIENSKPDLKIIYCGDDKNAIDVLKDYKNKTSYGFAKTNDHIIESVSRHNGNMSYYIDGREIIIKVIGNHNILNSAAAYLVGRQCKINSDNFNESMKTFKGVKRRLELKYNNAVRVYDDYAHHPVEVKATLDALRKIIKGRIVAVFQPHLFSRTRDFYKDFGKAFSDTDILILAKIYPAREKEIPGISSELIMIEYRKLKKEGSYIEDKEKILNELENTMKENDTVIFMGAGDITDLCDKFVKSLKAKTVTRVPL